MPPVRFPKFRSTVVVNPYDMTEFRMASFGAPYFAADDWFVYACLSALDPAASASYILNPPITGGLGAQTQQDMQNHISWAISPIKRDAPSIPQPAPAYDGSPLDAKEFHAAHNYTLPDVFTAREFKLKITNKPLPATRTSRVSLAGLPGLSFVVAPTTASDYRKRQAFKNETGGYGYVDNIGLPVEDYDETSPRPVYIVAEGKADRTATLIGHLKPVGVTTAAYATVPINKLDSAPSLLPMYNPRATGHSASSHTILRAVASRVTDASADRTGVVSRYKFPTPTNYTGELSAALSVYDPTTPLFYDANPLAYNLLRAGLCALDRERGVTRPDDAPPCLSPEAHMLTRLLCVAHAMTPREGASALLDPSYAQSAALLAQEGPSTPLGGVPLPDHFLAALRVATLPLDHPSRPHAGHYNPWSRDGLWHLLIDAACLAHGEPVDPERAPYLSPGGHRLLHPDAHAQIPADWTVTYR